MSDNDRWYVIRVADNTIVASRVTYAGAFDARRRLGDGYIMRSVATNASLPRAEQARRAREWAALRSEAAVIGPSQTHAIFHCRSEGDSSVGRWPQSATVTFDKPIGPRELEDVRAALQHAFEEIFDDDVTVDSLSESESGES